jgi:thioredoxin-dependent peroxiredoxin
MGGKENEQLRLKVGVAPVRPTSSSPDQDGNPVTLSSLKGGPVVLYFYLRADTPGR